MANTVVKMPQLGESVAEGTIGRWLKQPGERVERDEPLVEIQTDKVNAEVPSPVAGVLQRILLPEGATAPVKSDMAIIGDEVPTDAPVDAPSYAIGTPANEPSGVAVAPTPPPPMTFTYDDSAGGGVVGHRDADEAPPASSDGAAKRFYTPVVLRMAEEHDLDLATIQGTGGHGRVTRKDVERAIAESAERRELTAAAPPTSAPPSVLLPPPVPMPPAVPAPPAAPAAGDPRRGFGAQLPSLSTQFPSDGEQAGGVSPQPAPASFAPPPASPQAPSASPVVSVPSLEGGGEEVRALSPMRRAIAEHMTRARQEIPDAWSMVEIDVTQLAHYRQTLQAEWQAREGYELTYLPFFVKAVLAGLRAVPDLNASWAGDHLVIHRQLNLGIAVSVEGGLIVPVLRDADQLSVAGIARALRAIIQKARAGKLALDDLQGATFTVNNPGSLGSILSQPIVPVGQSGIVTMEAIVKRPVVTADDAIAIRSMLNSCLSFDHRVLDGAGALTFLRTIKTQLETVELPLY